MVSSSFNECLMCVIGKIRETGYGGIFSPVFLLISADDGHVCKRPQIPSHSWRHGPRISACENTVGKCLVDSISPLKPFFDFRPNNDSGEESGWDAYALSKVLTLRQGTSLHLLFGSGIAWETIWVYASSHGLIDSGPRGFRFSKLPLLQPI